MHHHNTQINPIFRKGSNQAAVLLIHGFTGTPDCLRYVANYLHSLSFTVSAPLLPGHGSTREKLAKTDWKEWYQTVKQAYSDLKKDYARIYVVGLSLGGLLSLKLAQDYPDNIHAMACLATPTKLNKWAEKLLPIITNTPLKYMYRYQKKLEPDVKDPHARINFYDIDHMPISCIQSIIKLQKLVRTDMSKITCPTLLMHSRYDSTAPFESMNDIAKNISATHTETVALENSFHLISIDYEKDLVCEKIGDFFVRFRE
ncbi:MAG: alpha/beta fold hydrolase [bacterium]